MSVLSKTSDRLWHEDAAGILSGSERHVEDDGRDWSAETRRFLA
jgi:hypothetical protein